MNSVARSKFVLSAAAALVALPVNAPAATVTLTASDAVGATSFNTTLHWSNAALPTAANDYVVGSGLTLRTPSSQSTNLTFQGNSLSLTDATPGGAMLLIRSLTGVTTTVNNLTLDGGQVQNAGNGTNAATNVTFASNGVTLGATGGTFSNLAAGYTLNINAPITGNGPLTLNAGGGLITLNAANANSYAGTTTISGSSVSNGSVVGSVRAPGAANIPAAGNLALANGVLEGSASITRLGGTAAGRVALSGAAAGFSAVGGDITVSIGGLASPTPLTWGSGALGQGILVLNNNNATNALTFTNDIDIGVATRTIFNTGTAAASSATVSGVLSSETASAGMNFYGGGVTIVTAANAITGTITIGSNANSANTALAGVSRVTTLGALGSGLVLVGSGGGNTTGRLEIVGGTTLVNAVSVPTRNGTSAAVESLSGDNTLINTVSLNSGGTYAVIQSDSGTLTLTGTAGSAAINSANGLRTATLQGAGDGTVSGLIVNGAGTVALAKSGVGVWSLTNIANTYTGPTTLIGGTLNAAKIASGTATSSIGASTNAAANLVLAGGRLRFTGGSASTDRLFTIGATGGTLDASGTAELTFANPAAHLTVDPATNGTTTNGSNTVTVTVGAVAGVIVGQSVTGSGIPNGATVTAVNYNAATFTISGNATANVTGSALTFGASPTRTFTLTGSNTGNNAINGALTNSAAGRVLAVTKSGTGTWALGGANTYTGVTTVTGGVLKASVPSGAADLLLTNAGGVNFSDTGGQLVLDYTAGGTSPIATVQNLLNTAYAAGGSSPTGFLVGQLRATTLTAAHTLGYGDTGSGQVTIRVTLPGDADLDGDVDFNDFIALQTHYTLAGTRFDEGNFDYDALTDFNDFIALQTNFGQSIGFGVPLPLVTNEQVAAMSAFALAHEVPEPAGCALLAGSFAGVLRRRRSCVGG